MATPLLEPAPASFLGPDPGRSIRVWAALLLRVGIGLYLLGTGLAGYFGMQAGGGPGNFWGPGGGSLSMLNPFMSGLPYLAIGLGLALILGFLTTASAIGAGFFNLILPVFAIIQVVATGSFNNPVVGMRFGNNMLFEMMVTMSLPNLLTNAAMIWLSPLENHPYSVDALIFGRDEIEPSSFPTGPARPIGPPAGAEAEAPMHIGE